MPQPFAEALSWVPKSRHLAATLSRAHDFARGLAHGTVMLEHLLLALIEDQDASVVLQACQVDLARLRADIDNHLVGLPGGQYVVPEAGRDLVRILDYAVAAAQQSRRREVNGAIVLAAIVGEGKSQAASILQSNGLTFAEAIRALQTSSVPPATQGPAASAAVSQATEQILASTRRRVDASRSGPVDNQPVQTTPAFAPPPEPQRAASGPGPSLPESGGFGSGVPPPPQPNLQSRPQSGPVPPPIPRAPAASKVASAGMRSARELAGGLVEAIRSAGAPWPQVAAPPATNPHEAPPDDRYRGNAAGPPFPDPDELAPPRAEPALDIPGVAAPLRPAAFDAARLVEKLPRTMRVGVPTPIEIRISRAELAALATGLDGRGAVYQHSIVVTKVLALRLRGSSDAFFVEASSPETQWIESSLGFLDDDYASWRWTVTPRRRGRGRLQLIASARTIGSDGATAETALPDQTIEVSIRTNHLRSAMRWGGLVAAVLVGGALTKFGEATWQLVLAVLGGGAQ